MANGIRLIKLALWLLLVVGVLVEVVVSDEEDLDEDENMEAFKNLFDKRVF